VTASKRDHIGDAGIVDQRVEASEALHGARHEHGAVRLPRDVPGERQHLHAARRAVARGFLQARGVARVEREMRALRGERQRQRAPDALGRPGDQHCLAGEAVHLLQPRERRAAVRVWRATHSLSGQRSCAASGADNARGNGLPHRAAE
jgi:hypothetical protein